MKHVAIFMTILMVMLSMSSVTLAAPADGGVVFNETFEAGNSSSIESGSAKLASVHSTGGYRGNLSQGYNSPKVLSADGLNSLGIDASSAVVLPMNGLLVNGYWFNFVALNNEWVNKAGTVYAGDIVFSSVMAKLKEDSQTTTAYLGTKMGILGNLKGIVKSTDFFSSTYPANSSLKTTLDGKSKDFGSYNSERWNWNNPTDKLTPVTTSDWTPVRYTMYYKEADISSGILINYLTISDHQGIYDQWADAGAGYKLGATTLDANGTPVYNMNATLLLDNYFVIRVPATAPLSAVYPVAYDAKISQQDASLSAEAKIYDVNAYATPSAKYQWQRKVDGEWTNIEGATAKDYVCTEADSEKEMRCQVYAVSTATDSEGNPSEVSSLSNNVCSYTPVVLAPKIGGDPELHVVSNIIGNEEFSYNDTNGNPVTLNEKTVLCYCKIANYTEDITSYGIKLTIGDQLYTLPGMRITEQGDFGIRAFGSAITPLESSDDYSAEGYFDMN